ncbi:MAG: NmrA family NAD(P)-binding protein [Agriterribacter sp.]
MNITITGSLGHIGRPLTMALVKAGHKVTVISSNENKEKEIEALGATAAVGRIDDAKFLTETFSSMDSAFCMIPPDYSQPDQVDYYARLASIYAKAIRNSGVKRIVHLSSYGAHLPSGTGFISGSHRTEQIFNGIPNIQLTLLRPTYFYYNLLHFVDMIKQAGFIAAVYGGEDKLSMVSPLDIAAAAAEELQVTDNVPHIRYVNSDERTCNEVAQILGKAIGIDDLKWYAFPQEKVLQSVLGTGMPENAAKNLVELGQALHTGKLTEDYVLHKPGFGKVKIEDYAIEFARIFEDEKSAH